MSKKKRDNVYNLYEYQFAKKVSKEVPEALRALDKAKRLCYNYRVYKDVFNVIHAIEDAKMMLEIHLETYQQVLKNKANRSESE